MMTLFPTSNSPLVSVMTPEMPVASIVSPSFATASACRNEPEPLSFVLVTLIVAARAGIATALNSITAITAHLAVDILRNWNNLP
jgi:hypothetical protein